MHLRKTFGGTAAAVLGLTALVGTGTAFAASPTTVPVDESSTTAQVDTDGDSFQKGDQTTPDTDAEAEAAEPAESAAGSAAESDGPGGHADPTGDVDHQFDGEE